MCKIITVQNCGISVAKYYEDFGLILVKERTRNWEISRAEERKGKNEIDGKGKWVERDMIKAIYK
jgi:hypothetical protein